MVFLDVFFCKIDSQTALCLVFIQVFGINDVAFKKQVGCNIECQVNSKVNLYSQMSISQHDYEAFVEAMTGHDKSLTGFLLLEKELFENWFRRLTCLNNKFFLILRL